MKITRTIAILALAGATACGGGRSATASTTAASQAAATTYQSTGQDMVTAVAAYGAATATIPDLAACQAAEAEYESRMNALLDRMRSQSGTMDHYMLGAMGSVAADMTCVAASMVLEYARHVAVACSSDVAADVAEASQHAATMDAWLDHQRVRYEQLGEAMGIIAGTNDTTWTCVRNGDGTFTMGGHTWVPSAVPTPTPTVTPTATPTPWPTTSPTQWPMPCGGWNCPCTGPGTGPYGGSTTPTAGGYGMPHTTMM